MKALLLLLFGCTTLSIQAQYLTAGLGTHVPVGPQKEKLKNAYGLMFGYEHQLKKSPFYVVFDLSWSIFDLKTVDQEVVNPDDGYVTKQTVNYTSSISTLTPGIGIAPLRDHNISPYVAIKGGYMKYKTLMTLHDPEDDNGCHPLDKESILRDYTAVAIANGGISIKIPTAPKIYFLDLGVNYITGGKAQYLRMTNDEIQPAPADAEPYMVKFEHAQTGSVHKHSLGDIYHTKTEQLQFYVRVKVPLCKAAHK
jgi:hypothetical protein